MSRRASVLHELTERLGQISAIDPPASAAGEAVRSLVGPGRVRDALGGRWLGHSLHPLLTDTVIGTWTSALLLDLLGADAEGEAAQRLIGLGLLAYGPTAATGAHDWADSELGDASVRRIGALHALINATAFGLQAASLAARRRGDRGRGVTLSLAAAGALGAGGHLGGHLSYVKGVGVDQTAFDASPEDWTAAMASSDLVDGQPTSVAVGDTPVLVVRGGVRVRAIHDRCSHRGCSLAEGRLDGDVIECGCHGSRFRLDDGGIERGPATSPQPAFDVREHGGSIEVRPRAQGR